MARTHVYSTRFKVFATLLLTVAIAAFVGAFLTSTSGGDDDPTLRAGAEDVVEGLQPTRNSQVPQQTTIGVDLAVGWGGTLVVNGTEIPEDQLDVTPELGLIQFTPGEGLAVEELIGGRNCVEAIVWPLSEGRQADARQISWCFSVV